MTQPASDAFFEADWLTLREPVDHASRAAALTEAAATWLGQTRAHAHCIVDLGSGRGSNLRYLAPRLPGAQRWRLIDHDPALLDAAVRASPRASADGQPVTVDCRVADIRDHPEQAVDRAALVTAAALFDLVSADWIARLVTACAQAGAAVLFALSVTGHPGFERDGRAASDADDECVFSLLAAHQQRDKGFGRALGTAAPGVLVEALDRAGYSVRVADSSWHLDSSRGDLAAALIAGWRAAAVQQAPWQRARITAWAGARVAAVRAGELGVTVGHRDVYAQPAGPRSP